MSILPPQSAPLTGTEFDEDFWRAASARQTVPANLHAKAQSDDASTAWAAFGDYLWLVAENSSDAPMK